MERLRGHLPFLLIWLAICLVLVLVTNNRIASGIGWDPDDQLRIVQLRDWLGGQSWLDTTQYRIGEPESQPMHWPRWIELPLALFVLLLTPLLGSAQAETAAMVLVPLLTLGVGMWIVLRITEQLVDRRTGLLAAALMTTSIPIVAQIRPMRIDHHGWQIVLALGALWTMLWPEKRKGGIALGAALALWLSISLEGLPLTAAFVVLLVWRWAIQLEDGVRLFWTLLTFAISSFFLYLASQGAFDMAANYCDALSPAHLFAIAAGGAIILPAIHFASADLRLRFAALAVAGLAVIGVLYITAPQCVGGAFGTMDPIVREYWLVNVLEGLPIWYQNPKTMVTLLGGSIVVGLVSLLYIIARRRSDFDREKLFLVGYAFLWAFLLSLFVQRAAAVAAAYALPFMAWAVHQLFLKARSLSRPATRILATVSVVFLIMPGPLAVAVYGAATGGEDSEAEEMGNAGKPPCKSDASLERLNILPRTNIAAPFDFGPRLLLLTPHSVLATSHHRNDSAMAAQIRIFTSEAGTSRELMERYNIRYVVACRGEAELDIYARKHPQGLWAQLEKGQNPEWMQPVHVRGNDLLIWRVMSKEVRNNM